MVLRSSAGMFVPSEFPEFPGGCGPRCPAAGLSVELPSESQLQQCILGQMWTTQDHLDTQDRCVITGEDRVYTQWYKGVCVCVCVTCVCVFVPVTVLQQLLQPLSLLQQRLLQAALSVTSRVQSLDQLIHLLHGAVERPLDGTVDWQAAGVAGGGA